MSDYSDSDEDSKINELERNLESNKYDYNSFLNLLNVHKSLGNYTESKALLEKYSKIFSLTEEIWLDWINDELEYSKFSQSNEDLRKVLLLAVDDYYSVKLCRMCKEHFPESIDLKERFKFDFNNAAYECKSIEEYKELLCVPHSNMKSTFESFKEFLRSNCSSEKEVDQNIWDILAKHEAAVQELKQLKAVEKHMASLKKPREQIDHLNMIQDIRLEYKYYFYEKLIVANPLNESIWLDYAMLVASTNDQAKLLSVVKKALKNIFWNCVMWEFYFLLRNPFQNLNEFKLEDFLAATKSSEYKRNLLLLKMYKQYDKKDECLKLLNTLEPSCDVSVFKANLYYRNWISYEESLNIWNHIFSTFTVDVEALLNYIRFVGIVSSEFFKTYSEYFYDIRLAEEWIRQEHIQGGEGLLEAYCYKQKVLKCDISKLNTKQKRLILEFEEKSMKKPKLEDSRKQSTTEGGKSGEEKSPKNHSESKIVNIGDIEKKTVFVSNLSEKTTKESLATCFEGCGITKDIRLVHDYKGKRTYAFIEFENDAAATKALEFDRSLLEVDGKKRIIYVNQYKDKKPANNNFNPTLVRHDKPKTIFAPRSISKSSISDATSKTNDEFRKLLFTKK